MITELLGIGPAAPNPFQQFVSIAIPVPWPGKEMIGSPSFARDYYSACCGSIFYCTSVQVRRPTPEKRLSIWPKSTDLGSGDPQTKTWTKQVRAPSVSIHDVQQWTTQNPQRWWCQAIHRTTWTWEHPLTETRQRPPPS